MYHKQLLLLIFYIFPKCKLMSHEKKIEALDVENSADGYGKDFPLCDLTENICDINCCLDEDCNAWERSSFNCSANVEEESDEGFADFSEIMCENGDGDPILCLQHSNSPYLGRFYEDHEEGDKYTEKNPKKAFSSQTAINIQPKESTTLNILKNNIPLNIFGKSGFCIPRPIRFLKNSESNCLYSISEASCLSNQLFNISTFLSPKYLSLNAGLKNITLVSQVICLNNGSKYLSVSRNVFQGDISNQLDKNEHQCGNSDFTRYNRSSQFCENVVVGLFYDFNVNQSLIASGSVKVLLADIPTTIQSLAKSLTLIYVPIEEKNHLYLHISQRISIHFNKTGKFTNTLDGYRIGDRLTT